MSYDPYDSPDEHYQKGKYWAKRNKEIGRAHV